MSVDGGGQEFVVDVCDTVCCLSFSQYEWSTSLLAVGTKERVSIFSCTFPEEDPAVHSFEYELVREFHQSCPVTAVSFSPQTNLKELSKELRFVTAGCDMKLRYFSSNLKEVNTVAFCEGHSSHVNDVAIEPSTGEEIASVSDDYSCCIWDTDGLLKYRFLLTSPGMSVSWHPSKQGKLIIGEKKGLIRMYSTALQEPTQSFDSSCVPLMCAKWCPSNSLLLGAVAGTDWILWNYASSRPVKYHTVHEDGAALMEFSNINPDVFATRNCKGDQVKIINCKVVKPILVAEFTIGRGLSWHHKFQVLAVGGDKKVHLLKI